MSDNVVDPNDVSSKSTFVTSLITNLAIAGGELVAFLILRYRFKRIYSPRVDLPPEGKRMKALPRGILSIIPAILFADDELIIGFNGLDAYLFVRFLKLMMWIFGPIALVTWIILLPVYGTSTMGSDGLNQFTFGNIGRDQQSRLGAPLVLVYLSTFFILYMIKREWGNYVDRRQEFLTSRYWATKAQARTVLVTGIPDDYLNQDALMSMADFLPGGVRQIWLARDPKELEDIYDRMIKAAKKLESANVSQIKLANKLVRKGKIDAGGSDERVEQNHAVSQQQQNQQQDQTTLGHKPENGPQVYAEKKFEDLVASRYLLPKNKSSHKLGAIPFTGKKVQSIPWALDELAETNRLLEEKRRDLSKYPPKSAAFILFNDQIAAHIFAQCLAHDLPLRMSNRYINVSPKDIIWFGLNINPYSSRLRFIASWAATSAIIIFWSFPTAFVTSISNVTAICEKVHWLNWLCTLPTPLNGIIQGVLPPVALALLFLLLPPLFRFLAIFEGIPMRTLVEHSLQRRYFAFLFVQGFIVASLSSGIMASIQQIIDSPTSTVSLLAQNLPKASIFFLTLVVTSGLSGAAGGILQVVRLVLYYVRIVLLGGSPRSIWKIKYTMPKVEWGQTYPSQSLLVVIALAYSTIAPLVCGFALLSFSLWWFGWKYLFLWVYDQPAETETGGMFFKTAINQIFAGLYIEHLCLIGLFFLARNTEENVSALPEAILTIILMIITIFVQLTLNSGLSPLSEYLPLSMAQEMDANEARYAREMAEEKHQQRFQQRFRSPSPANGEVQDQQDVDASAGPARPSGEEARAPIYAAYASQPMDRAGHSSNTYPPPTMSTPLHKGEKAPRRNNNADLEGGDGEENDAAPDPNEEGQAADDMDELGGTLGEHAFHHPALYRAQPTIWLPRDQLGLSAEAVANARRRGIDITDEDSVISADKGKITISRSTLPGVSFDVTQE